MSRDWFGEYYYLICVLKAGLITRNEFTERWNVEQEKMNGAFEQSIHPVDEEVNAV